MGVSHMGGEVKQARVRRSIGAKNKGKSVPTRRHANRDDEHAVKE